MSYLKRLPKFEYLAPRSVPEVCEFVAKYGREAKLLAGGTDLIIMMRRREVVPRYVIGLKNVPELDFIRSDPNGGLAIGAMSTCWAIQVSPIIRQRYDFLAETAADIGSVENLHVSTIGGNLCGGLPCVDFPAPLLTLGAMVKLVSTGGERIVPLDGFFLDYEKTALGPDEVLTEIQIPPQAPRSATRSGTATVPFPSRSHAGPGPPQPPSNATRSGTSTALLATAWQSAGQSRGGSVLPMIQTSPPARLLLSVNRTASTTVPPVVTGNARLIHVRGVSVHSC